MRIKKGFTLAEVLIVLMVIGAIATMTIPSLMKGVTETQWKTTYKKAFNAIVNLCAMERVAGSLPSTSDNKGVLKMFESMVSSLAIKDYADAPTDISDGSIITSANYKTGVTYTDSNGITIQTGSDSERASYNNSGTTTPWINTEDGISYLVTTASGNTCGTKEQIDSNDDSASQACVIVVVDVNGISKGPNVVEPQQTAELDTSKASTTLTGDRFYIFIGRDGATAGNKTKTISGRIVADLK